jgi:hypothetical protein
MPAARAIRAPAQGSNHRCIHPPEQHNRDTISTAMEARAKKSIMTAPTAALRYVASRSFSSVASMMVKAVEVVTSAKVMSPTDRNTGLESKMRQRSDLMVTGRMFVNESDSPEKA